METETSGDARACLPVCLIIKRSKYQADMVRADPLPCSIPKLFLNDVVRD